MPASSARTPHTSPEETDLDPVVPDPPESTMRTVIFFQSIFALSTASFYPFLYNSYNPYTYNALFRNYAHNIQSYAPFVPTFTNEIVDDRIATSSYLAPPEKSPVLNILAEAPYSISTKFTVVPMLVMSKDSMRMVSNAQVMSASKSKPILSVRTPSDKLMQCTPAVRIILDTPLVVTSLRTSLLFPSEVLIAHQGYRIPIHVGAVVAPVLPTTYVSAETPVAIRVVYAIPTSPVKIELQPGNEVVIPNKPDYINNEDAIFVPETEAVIVESDTDHVPPQNVTVIDFPDKEAEPNLQVDEEDDELVNRNPPQVLAPAGIVQSTQPLSHQEQFHNSKESDLLTELREQSKKKQRIV